MNKHTGQVQVYQTFDRQAQDGVTATVNHPERYQAFAEAYMRFSIFWNFTHRTLVVSFRRFEIKGRSHLQGSSSLLAESYWRFGKTYRSHLQGPSFILAESYWRFGKTYRSHLQGPSCILAELLEFREDLSVPSSRAKLYTGRKLLAFR